MANPPRNDEKRQKTGDGETGMEGKSGPVIAT